MGGRKHVTQKMSGKGLRKKRELKPQFRAACRRRNRRLGGSRYRYKVVRQIMEKVVAREMRTVMLRERDEMNIVYLALPVVKYERRIRILPKVCREFLVKDLYKI